MTRTILPTLVITVLSLLAAGCGGRGRTADHGIGDPLWGQYRGDGAQSGRSSSAGTQDGNAAWVASVGGDITGVVTIDGRGDLRVKPAGNLLHCLRPDGSLRWSTAVGPGARTVVLDRFGSSFLGTDDGFLVIVSADGEIRFRQSVGTSLGTGLQYSDDAFVFPGADGRLFFVHRSGDALATLAVGGVGVSAPVALNSRQLFVASVNGNLYEIRIDGVTRLPSVGSVLPIGAAVSRSTPVSDGRLAYVVNDKDQLVAFFEDPFDLDPAKVVWTFDPSSGATAGGASTPVVRLDGSLVYGTTDGRLIAVGRGGHELWSRDLGSPVKSAPVQDGTGNLYVRTADGAIHSVDQNGEPRFRRERGDASSSSLDPSPSMDADGNLYFGTHSGQVLRLGSSPLFGQVGHDAAHSAVSGTQGPLAPTLRHVVDAGFAPVGPIVVLGDGGVAWLGADGVVRHHSPSGALVRSFGIGTSDAKLAADPSGRFWITDSLGALLLFSANGVQLQRLPLVSGGALSSATLRADGGAYVVAESGLLFAISSDGLLERTVSLGHGARVAPAVDREGGLRIATTDGFLLILDAGLRIRASVTLPGGVTRAVPLVDDTGRCAVSTDRDAHLVIAADGTGLWLFEPADPTSEGGIGGIARGDGTVIFAGRTGVVRSFETSTGALEFATDLGSKVAAPLVADADGRLHLLDEDGGVHVLEADGTPRDELAGGAWRRDSAVALVLAGERSLRVLDGSGRLAAFEDAEEWSVDRGTPDRRSRPAAVAPRAPAVDWSLPLGEAVVRSVLLDADGRGLVVGADGGVFRVDDTGTLFDSTAVGQDPTVPVFLPGGGFAVGTEAGVLSAFDPALENDWFLVLGGAVGALNRTPGGDVLATSADGSLRRVDGAGRLVDRVDVVDPSLGGPCLGPDGVVRVAGGDARLRRFALEDGALLGSTDLPSAVTRSSPLALPGGGTLLLTDRDELVAIDADGDVVWTHDPSASGSDGGDASPALLVDGAVAYATQDGDLIVLEADGSLRFSLALGAAVHRGLLVDAEGEILACPDDGLLHSITPAGVERYAFDVTEGGTPAVLTAPVLDRSGALWLGSQDGTLYRVR